MVRRAAVLSPAVLAAMLMHCSLITSVDGLTGRTEAADAADAIAETETGSSAEAGTDSGPTDAALYPDVPDGGCLCAQPAPPGWQGPVVLAESLKGAAPACSGDYGDERFAGTGSPLVPPAQCACAPCSAPTGQTCPNNFTVKLHQQTSCTIAYSDQPMSASCWNVGGASARGVISTPPAPTDMGTCTTQLTTNDVPAVTWERSARVCGSTTALGKEDSCVAGEVCVAPPRAPFLPRLCVLATGEMACPAGSAYSVQHVYFTGGSDTRACTGCSCAAATGTTCAGSFHTFDSASCMVETGAYPLTSACTSLTTAPMGMSITVAPSGGSCALSGGQATGAFTPSGATTVCCLP